MEQPVITFALAKGRLAEQAFDLLEQLGIDCSEPRNPGRQLVLWDKEQNIRFILVKPSDVPTYVDHGVADLGIVGKDTLLEAGRELYEVLDLGFGKCRFALAVKEGSDFYGTRAAASTARPSASPRSTRISPEATTTAKGRRLKLLNCTVRWNLAPSSG